MRTVNSQHINVGEKTYEEVKQFIEEQEDSYLGLKILDIKMHESYQMMRINELVDFHKTIYCHKNSTVLSCFNDYKANIKENLSFSTIKLYHTYKFFVGLINKDIMTINDKLTEIFLTLKIDDQEIDIYTKRCQGLTLTAIGTIYNLTRERIRQREKIIFTKLKNTYHQLAIGMLLDKDIVMLSNNQTGLFDHYYQIFVRRLAEYDSNFCLVVIDDKDVYYKKSFYESMKLKFDLICTKLKSQISFPLENLKDVDIDSLLFKYFMNKNGLVLCDDVISNKVNKRGMVRMYLEKKQLVDVSKENIANVMKELNDKYNIDCKTERSVVALFQETAFAIGKMRYAAYSNIPLMDSQTLRDIISEIEESRYVNAIDLTKRFGDRIKNLLSPAHLYSYLKRMFPHEYNYGGTNLKISVLGESVSDSIRVYNYLKEKGMPINYEEITNELDVKSYSLSVIIQQNDNIIRYGGRRMYLKEKIVHSAKVKEVIDEYIDSNIDYFNLTSLFRLALERIHLILKENYIY